MANEFKRKPIIGGDLDAWAPFNDAFIRDAIGMNSCRLYDSSGNLRITEGRIGINDGTNEGIAVIDTDTLIDMSLVSNGNWAKIELSVSGTSVTIAAADISGETTNLLIPDVVKNAYSSAKTGYYITSTKRLIGIAYKDSLGALSFIYNTENGIKGFKETKLFNGYDSSLNTEDIYMRNIRYEIGDWNMDSTAVLNFTVNFLIEYIKNIYVIIRDDSDASYYDLNTLSSGYLIINKLLQRIELRRIAGELFDSTAFDSTTYNRGWIYLKVEV